MNNKDLMFIKLFFSFGKNQFSKKKIDFQKVFLKIYKTKRNNSEYKKYIYFLQRKYSNTRYLKLVTYVY